MLYMDTNAHLEIPLMQIPTPNAVTLSEDTRDVICDNDTSVIVIIIDPPYTFIFHSTFILLFEQVFPSRVSNMDSH